MAVDGVHNFVTVTVSSVNDSEAEQQVYPNPTTGMVTVKAAGMSRLTVLNALGQVVMDAEAESDEVSLDLSSYQVGLYLIRVETAEAVTVRRVTLTR